MNGKINHIIQSYFVKKRIVFSINRTKEYKYNDEYSVFEIDDDILKRYNNFLQQHIDRTKLIGRVSNPDCTGFLAVHRKTNKAVGFEWAIVSKKREYRHDNFLVPRNEGLLFNAYITEEHRGKGIFGQLKIMAANHLICKKKCNNAYSVVESTNTSSIKANQKIGSIDVGRNYLIKIFKRNLLSITKINNEKPTIEYVLTGSKKVKM